MAYYTSNNAIKKKYLFLHCKLISFIFFLWFLDNIHASDWLKSEDK